MQTFHGKLFWIAAANILERSTLLDTFWTLFEPESMKTKYHSHIKFWLILASSLIHLFQKTWYLNILLEKEIPATSLKHLEVIITGRMLTVLHTIVVYIWVEG